MPCRYFSDRGRSAVYDSVPAVRDCAEELRRSSEPFEKQDRGTEPFERDFCGETIGPSGLCEMRGSAGTSEKEGEKHALLPFEGRIAARKGLRETVVRIILR